MLIDGRPPVSRIVVSDTKSRFSYEAISYIIELHTKGFSFRVRTRASVRLIVVALFVSRNLTTWDLGKQLKAYEAMYSV